MSSHFNCSTPGHVCCPASTDWINTLPSIHCTAAPRYVKHIMSILCLKRWLGLLFYNTFFISAGTHQWPGSVFKEGTRFICLLPCLPNHGQSIADVPYLEVTYTHHTLKNYGMVEHSVVTSVGSPGCVYKDGGLTWHWTHWGMHWGIYEGIHFSLGYVLGIYRGVCTRRVQLTSY